MTDGQTSRHATTPKTALRISWRGLKTNFSWKGAQIWLRNCGYASAKSAQDALIQHKKLPKFFCPSPDPTPTREGCHPPQWVGTLLLQSPPPRCLESSTPLASRHYAASYSKVMDPPLVFLCRPTFKKFMYWQQTYHLHRQSRK